LRPCVSDRSLVDRFMKINATNELMLQGSKCIFGVGDLALVKSVPNH